MKITNRGRSGVIVCTKTNKLGFLWNDEGHVNGKALVYIIDYEHNETGEKLLCQIDTLVIKGFIN